MQAPAQTLEPGCSSLNLMGLDRVKNLSQAVSSFVTWDNKRTPQRKWSQSSSMAFIRALLVQDLPASLHVIFLPSGNVKAISLCLQMVLRLGAEK